MATQPITPDQADPTADFTAGVASVADDPNSQARQQEAKDAASWLSKIEKARKFDENARRRYVIDRRYASTATTGFEVSLPIAASYIDILVSFLYARNPDVDCEPSDATTPPPESEIKKLATAQVMADPNTATVVGQAGIQAKQQAEQAAIASVGAALIPKLLNGGAGGETPPASASAGDQANAGAPALPPQDPEAAGNAAMEQARQGLIKAKTDEIMAPYRQRLSEAKQYGETIEAVLSHLWDKGNLKKCALPVVKSSTTVAIGWMKATWQERLGNDPVVEQEIADLLDNIKSADYLRKCLESGDYGANDDEVKAKLEQTITGLQANVEKVVARGMAFDFISAEDIIVSTEVPSLANYLDSPWIAHRFFMPKEKAGATFDLSEEDLKSCTQYFQTKPSIDAETILPNTDPANYPSIDPSEADRYKTGGSGMGEDRPDGNICGYEVWCRDTNMIVAVIEGLKKYARAPYPPDPGATRFYPFFQMAPLQVDGQRHPDSLIKRSRSLLDEMNRIYSAAKTHRTRSVPKTVFNSSGMEPAEVLKVENGGIQEMVGIKPLDPQANMSHLFVPVAYAQFDEALYDDAATRAQLETAWGIQEALSSSIQTAKTAHEAEIQQKGTEARTSFQRDALDMMMQDLANYCAEIGSQKLTVEDAQAIAGPFAFWPKLSINDMSQLIKINIRAGSSGKPDTSAQQQAWATTMPVLQGMIMQIGQLRGSSPADVADCLEALVQETIARTGDKLDPDRFLPGAPDAQNAMPGPAALPAPATAPISDGPTVLPAGITLQ